MKFPIIFRMKNYPRPPYIGRSFFIFVVFRKDITVRDHNIRHETIHMYQELELLIIGFVIIYYTEYLLGYLRYRNLHKAYSNISFEREAYAHQCEPDYLKHRKLFANFRPSITPARE